MNTKFILASFGVFVLTAVCHATDAAKDPPPPPGRDEIYYKERDAQYERDHERWVRVDLERERIRNSVPPANEQQPRKPFEPLTPNAVMTPNEPYRAVPPNSGSGNNP